MICCRSVSLIMANYWLASINECKECRNGIMFAWNKCNTSFGHWWCPWKRCWYFNTFHVSRTIVIDATDLSGCWLVLFWHNNVILNQNSSVAIGKLTRPCFCSFYWRQNANDRISDSYHTKNATCAGFIIFVHTFYGIHSETFDPWIAAQNMCYWILSWH